MAITPLDVAVSGNDILVEVAGSVIGFQQGATFNETRGTVDVTSKDDDRVTKYVEGRYAATVTCSALFIDGDTGYGNARTAIRNGTAVTLIRQEPQGEGGVAGTPTDFETCSAFVDSISQDYPVDAPATCEVSFTVNGGWSVVS